MKNSDEIYMGFDESCINLLASKPPATEVVDTERK
jgi:hypothetical protein